MDGTYHMLAEAHEADLAREAERYRRAQLAGRCAGRHPPRSRRVLRRLAQLATQWARLLAEPRLRGLPTGRKMYG